MVLYRVTHRQYADNFDGRGASFEDGARWNSAGNPAIYFGLNMATAMLEVANYIPNPRLIPASYCKASYQIPETTPIQRLDFKQLPDDWQAMPYPTSTQGIGDQFLNQTDALLLLLPSVAVGTQEHLIALVNPLHPHINDLKLISVEQPVYSSRMFGGL